MDQGINVSHSRPRHPQTNGKNERFNRTLKTELLEGNYIKNLTHAQSLFDTWRKMYNMERPHEAIGLEVPISRYKASHREYKEKEMLEAYDYDKGMLIRKIDYSGKTGLHNVALTIGVGFARRYVGFRETKEDGVYDVYYRHQKIKTITLKKR